MIYCNSYKVAIHPPKEVERHPQSPQQLRPRNRPVRCSLLLAPTLGRCSMHPWPEELIEPVPGWLIWLDSLAFGILDHFEGRTRRILQLLEQCVFGNVNRVRKTILPLKWPFLLVSFQFGQHSLEIPGARTWISSARAFKVILMPWMPLSRSAMLNPWPLPLQNP